MPPELPELPPELPELPPELPELPLPPVLPPELPSPVPPEVPPFDPPPVLPLPDSGVVGVCCSCSFWASSSAFAVSSVVRSASDLVLENFHSELFLYLGASAVGNSSRATPSSAAFIKERNTGRVSWSPMKLPRSTVPL